MKKSLRIVLILCVLALTSFALIPAHAQDSAVPSVMTMPDKIADGRAVTFTITNEPPETDTAGRQQFLDQIARFEALYPNVTVQGDEYTYAPDTFAALVAGNQVPTMF